MSKRMSGANNPFYGKHHSKDVIEDNIFAHLGKKASSATRRKMRLAHSGENNHFYGKHHTIESKNKITLKKTGKNLGRHTSTEIKASDWKSPSFRHERIKRIVCTRPTRLEKKFISLFKEKELPLLYVGDRSFMIGRLNPDFIDMKGKRVVVEVRSVRMTVEFCKKNFEDYKVKRVHVLANAGWKCYVFSDKDLQSPLKIVNTLRRGLG